LVCAFVAYYMIKGNIAALDFRDAYRAAGHRLLDGLSPYAWNHAQIDGGEVFVYPPLAALLMVPFALLPTGLSAPLFSALCAAAALGTLRVLDVRDWRLYGVAIVWPWVVAGWQTGNLTLLLGLGIALLWRYRDRPVAAGLLVGLLVSLKPFTLPLGLWLLASRRRRGAAWAIAAAVVVNIAAWAAIGFGEIRRYVELSSRVTSALQHTGYGIISAAEHVGLGQSAGVFLEIALGCAAAALCVIAARRRDDLASLTGAIVLMLIAWPLVWSHYFALLIIPVAIAYPRLNRAWFLPLLLWGCAVRGASGWQIILSWAIVVVICLEVLAPRMRTDARARAGAC
jgi:alpha-1,2-mannosyltransferase